MKATTKFLLAALIAIGFMGCRTDDLPPYSGVESGLPATMSITVLTDSPRTRALRGDIDADKAAESAIHSLEVWLFRADGTAAGHRFFNAAALTSAANGVVAEGISAESGNLTMVVVANNPEIGNVTRSTLQGTLAGPLSQDISTGMVMTSEEVSVTLTPGNNFFGQYPDGTFAGNNISPTQNLTLHRVHARIALVDVNFNNLHNNPAFDGFELDKVALFNVRNNARLFGPTSFAATASLVYGVNDAPASFWYGFGFPTTENSYIGTPNAGLLYQLADAETFADITRTNAIYFYVYPNHGSELTAGGRDAYGTFMVLRGQMTLGGNPVTNPDFTDAAGFTYFAIWVNCRHFGAPATGVARGTNVINRNTRYNITVNILGAGNPSVDPDDDAFLDVRVEIEDWDIVEQEVDWGVPPAPTCPMEITTPVVQSYVLIYGERVGYTRWATVNVDKPGTFAPYPWSFGLMYQWGVNVGWEHGPGEDVNGDPDPTSFTGISAFAPQAFSGTPTWQTNAQLAAIQYWNPIAGSLVPGTTDTPHQRGPCPTGWRLPTEAEWRDLTGNIGLTTFHAGHGIIGVSPGLFGTGVGGRWFGLRNSSTEDAPSANIIPPAVTMATIDTANRIFIPAAGRRDQDGIWAPGIAAALEASVWTSTLNATGQPWRVIAIRAGTGQAPIPGFEVNRAMGMTVRCVQVKDSDFDAPPPPPPPPPAYVDIAGLRWSQHNVGLPGEFATTGIGMMYQWGSNIAWNPGPTLSSPNPAAPATWQTADDLSGINNDWYAGVGPCPTGWRLPTVAEFEALLAFGDGVDDGSGDNGPAVFSAGSLHFGQIPNRLSFPLTGRRNGSAAGDWAMTAMGFYFAVPATPHDTDIMRLQFSDTTMGVPGMSSNTRLHGQFVRCVQAIPPTP